MIGYNKTVTIYHKSLTDETVKWEPATVGGVYAEDTRAINTSSTTTASAPATLVDFPAAAWDRCNVEPGDYIVVGGCDIDTFSGSVARLLDAGGRQVESVAKHLYGSSLDHVEVTAQ